MPYTLYASLAGEDKISRWDMDPQTGGLKRGPDFTLSGGPAPLAVDPAQQRIYVAQRATCQLSTLDIDPHDGHLSLRRTIDLPADPCYLGTSRNGRFLLSAYYRAGHVAVHAIDEEGAAVGPAIEWRATAPRAHCVQTDPADRWAFVPHVMDANAIFQFAFDARTGHLAPNPIPAQPGAPDAGPRHYVFHPRKHVVYAVNEQGCSVTAYHFDAAHGTLAPFQTISTLPSGFEGENTCAQIHIAPKGRYLYASNRGHDSIACFAIQAGTGRLAARGYQLTEKTPRAFGLDPQGRYLYAAGLDSGRLAAYEIDPADGTLRALATYPLGARPMWVRVLALGEENLAASQEETTQ